MKNLILYILIFFSFAVQAQKKDIFLPKANQEFEKKEFIEAEANYRISQSRKPTEATATYNLGNAIYKMNQPGEAKYAYAKAIQNAKTKTEKHRAFHNLGNVFMSEKKYQEAVSAFQNALRNDPSDEETRYNYALAKEYLKNNPPPPDKNDDKDKDKDDKDKDKDKKDQNKDDKGDKEDKNKDGDDKDDKKEGKDKEDKSDDKDNKGKDPQGEKGNKEQNQNPQQQQGQGGGISKQRLENILEAVNNEEKKVQEKVNAQKVKGRPVQKEKNW